MPEDWPQRVSEAQKRKFMRDPAARLAAQEQARRLFNLPQSKAARQRSARERQIWKIAAKGITPESRKIAGERSRATRLAWCPPELRDEYVRLIRSCRMNAAEARGIILRQHEADMARFRHRAAPETYVPPQVVLPPPLNRRGLPKRRQDPPAPLELIAWVARSFGFTLDDVMGDGRANAIVRCRQTAYAILRAEGHDYALIGRWLGRDHSTVIHGCKLFDIHAKHAPLMRQVFNAHRTAWQDNNAEAACAA